MTGFIIWVGLFAVVLFFIINGWYIKKDIDNDPYDPFDETARREEDEEGLDDQP